MSVSGSVRDSTFFLLLEVLVIAKELLINEQIKVKEARMLDENGNQLGIMPLAQARAYAFDHGVDLVLIAPQATPPVCRAMDYGKYRYESDKKEKEAKKKQSVMEVKEVQLSCRIAAFQRSRYRTSRKTVVGLLLSTLKLSATTNPPPEP